MTHISSTPAAPGSHSGRLAGRVAIVTGGAQGLGAEYAVALAGAGALVAIGDIQDAGPAVQRILDAGGTALAVHVDVTDEASVQAMVDEVVATWGRLDVMVNNAALVADLDMRPLLEISAHQWDRVMAVNARGTFACIKAAGRVMVRAGAGKIINIASSTFYKGAPLMAHYVASKGAVIGLTRTAARELGAHGITVNCISPGLTMTPVLRDHAVFGDAVLKSAIDSRALRREQTAGDLLGTLLFLASPDSDFMTGQTLVVDGGGVMQ